MRFKVYSLLVLLCSAFVAGAFAQDMDHVKSKIQRQLDNAKKDSVVAFDEKGNELTDISVSQTERKNFKSLSDFLVKDDWVFGGSKRKGNGGDPIATCEEPKVLKPPPECVLCKNGQRICSEAAFGREAELGIPR